MMRIASLCILALAGVAGYIQIDSRLPWAPFAMPPALESELQVAEPAPEVVGKKTPATAPLVFLSRAPSLFQRLQRRRFMRAPQFF